MKIRRTANPRRAKQPEKKRVDGDHIQPVRQSRETAFQHQVTDSERSENAVVHNRCGEQKEEDPEHQCTEE